MDQLFLHSEYRSTSNIGHRKLTIVDPTVTWVRQHSVRPVEIFRRIGVVPHSQARV